MRYDTLGLFRGRRQAETSMNFRKAEGLTNSQAKKQSLNKKLRPEQRAGFLFLINAIAPAVKEDLRVSSKAWTIKSRPLL